MNSLTVNLHLMMVAFYRPTADKFKVSIHNGSLLHSLSPHHCLALHQILVEAKAFPSDAHMLESQVRFHGYDPDTAIIKIAPREGEVTLRTEDIIQVIQSDPQVASSSHALIDPSFVSSALLGNDEWSPVLHWPALRY